MSFLLILYQNVINYT